jgi:hypothetical protein
MAAWLLAALHFPETMHQVRLVMLLLAIGGPEGEQQTPGHQQFFYWATRSTPGAIR